MRELTLPTVKSFVEIVDSFHLESIKGGLRIQKIVNRVWLTLAAISAAAVVASFIAAVVIPSTVELVILGIALSTLGVCIGRQVYAHVSKKLTGKLRYLTEIIHATVVDYFVVLLCTVLYPFSIAKWDQLRLERGECIKNSKPVNGFDPHRPIILVHGYLHNSSAWYYLRNRFKEMGCTNIFTIDLGHPMQSIDDYALKVSSFVDKVKKATGRNDIAMVGHSMGGVVISHYCTEYAQKDGIQVKTAITLGSPLLGTLLGWLGIGKCAQEMRFKSPFVVDLNQKMDQCTETHFCHLSSNTDLVVIPNHSARRGTSLQRVINRLYAVVGHCTYLFDDTVGDEVCDRIKPLIAP